MKAFSKKYRNLAMQIICDFYANDQVDRDIDPDYLYSQGLPRSVDAEQLISVLEGMGYLEVTRYYNAPCSFTLTGEGCCYFERKADMTHEKLVEWIRYIITTAIAVVALIKSFLPEICALMERLGLVS